MVGGHGARAGGPGKGKGAEAKQVSRAPSARKASSSRRSSTAPPNPVPLLSNPPCRPPAPDGSHDTRWAVSEKATGRLEGGKDLGFLYQQKQISDLPVFPP